MYPSVLRTVLGLKQPLDAMMVSTSSAVIGPNRPITAVLGWPQLFHGPLLLHELCLCPVAAQFR